MKKMWSLAMISAILLACNAEGSKKETLDSLQNKVDSIAERTWDSGQKDLKTLKERIREKLNDKDSVEN